MIKYIINLFKKKPTPNKSCKTCRFNMGEYCNCGIVITNRGKLCYYGELYEKKILTCPACNGSGGAVEAGTWCEYQKCCTCNGKGTIKDYNN